MTESLKKVFFQGRIEEAYQQAVKAQKNIPAACPEILGALVFKGDFERAEIFYRDQFPELPPSLKAGCLFYLMVGHVRKSEYGKARKFLAGIKDLLKSSPKDEDIRFYYAQGMAFYAYYHSDYERAVKWAKHSLRSSLKLGFEFGELIARDLLGGALVAQGNISQGLKELEKSLKVAEALGNGGFVSALKVSILGMESRYGKISDPVQKLQFYIESLCVEDTYSLSDLKLELSRQLLLRGRAIEAEKVLNECSSLIYASQNQRQAATLHHRLAFLMCVKGQYQSALTLLQVAAQSLNPKLDQVFEGRLMGLKNQILKKLGLAGESLRPLQSDSVHVRTLARDQGQILKGKQGEDSLGDLIDQIVVRKNLKALAAQGLWHFLPEVLNLDRQKNHLIFGLEGSSLTICSQGQVIHVPKSIGGLSEKLLVQISRQNQSKEQLIQKVWGYEYSPLRHDALVYSLVAQLRKQFGPFSHWLEMTDQGYSLQNEVEILDLRSKTEKGKSTKPVEVKEEINPNFNFRQNEWLAKASDISRFSIGDYKKHFSISTMTAYRDIDEMLENRWIKKSGFGRATRYHFMGL